MDVDVFRCHGGHIHEVETLLPVQQLVDTPASLMMECERTHAFRVSLLAWLDLSCWSLALGQTLLPNGVFPADPSAQLE